MLLAANSTLLTLLAFCGHTARHRIQEIQLFGSVFDGSAVSIALTGHAFAQSPHPVQALPACGFHGNAAVFFVRTVPWQF